jgi:CBS domain-containing protein
VLVRDLMTEAVVTAEPSVTVQAVAQLMRERNVGSVVLVENRRPVGFITDRDLALSVVADGRTSGDSARDHASSPVIMAEPEMDVEEALALMLRHDIRRLVVVIAGSLAAVS